MLNGFGDRSEIEQIREGIQSASDVEVIYNAADMSRPDEIVEMITETQKTLGSLLSEAPLSFFLRDPTLGFGNFNPSCTLSIT